MVFKIFGVKIKIEYSFLLLISFLLAFGAKDVLYVLLFASLHETGHLLLLYAVGGKAEKITLSYYGIGLIHKSRLGKMREIIFLCGGCAVNLLFSLLNVKREINLPLFLMNILPIYPLDGGRILKLIFGFREKPFRIVSAVFLFTLIAFSVYERSLNLILISLYLAIFSFNEENK